MILGTLEGGRELHERHINTGLLGSLDREQPLEGPNTHLYTVA